MQHMLNSVSRNVSKCSENVWYVDSSASNHMTSCGEWFRDMRKPEVLGFVQTGDDTARPIAHIGDVP